MWYTEEITHRGTSSLGKTLRRSRAGSKIGSDCPLSPRRSPSPRITALNTPQVLEDPHNMTSCQQTLCSVKILLLLSLVLPVTPDSSTASPSTTTEPASAEPFTTSTSNEPETDQATKGRMHASSTAGLDIRNDHPTTAAEQDKGVLNATEANNATSAAFTVSTTPLADTEPTTTNASTTSMYQAITRRSTTASEDTIHARAKDETRRLEHDRIFSYDYTTLRQWGLICALLLCIIGFLVLFSGRCRGFSCRRRQKRKYNITGI